MSTADPKPYTIDDHPKARRSIETTRSWAALISCGLVALLSIQAGSTAFDGIVRGLIAGCLMFLLAWGVTVMVWREIVRAEIAQAREQVRERREAARQAILDAQQALADQRQQDA
ncbi:MAG: hypothetical protein ACSLFR_01350 [Solirubrobacteraceae bacterium]